MPSTSCNCPDSECGGPQEICIRKKCIKVRFSLLCLLFESSNNKVIFNYANDLIHFRQVRCHNEEFCYNRDINSRSKLEIQGHRDLSGFRQIVNGLCDDNDAQRVCSVRTEILTCCMFLSILFRPQAS